MSNPLAEKFGECLGDYADMNANVAGRLVRMAQHCRDPKILTRINLLIKYIEHEGSKIKLNLEGKMDKSKCCNVLVIVDSGDEGTSCWVCTKCGEACDIIQEPVFASDQVIHESKGPVIPDCSNHPQRIVRYDGTLKELAEDIGNLRYDKQAELYNLLVEKHAEDSTNDRTGGRIQLSMMLSQISWQFVRLKESTLKAWEICKPYMK